MFNGARTLERERTRDDNDHVSKVISQNPEKMTGEGVAMV
jgi:hypothetical protein